MNKHFIALILGRLLMVYSLSLIPVFLIAVFNEESEHLPFLLTGLQTAFLGLLLYLLASRKKNTSRTGIKESFFIVVMYWVIIGLAGALPFILSSELAGKITIIDAIFESFSGLTTTGATIFTSIEELSPAIKFYRQQLQWIGGMGIIILAVAVLPALGVGGVQLYRAEIVGPIKTEKLTPRVSGTAKKLWLIYLLLTISCAIGYYLSGMSVFDAIAHSFSTISMGGFSTYSSSIGHFNSIAVEIVASIFMVLSGINFALHYGVIRYAHRRSLWSYFTEVESRTYLLLLLTICVIVSTTLYLKSSYQSPEELFRYGVFQTLSITTTTGFANTQWHLFPVGLPILLILSSFIGGCSGSTAGGMKVIRVIMIFKQGSREVLRLIHPNVIRSLLVNQNVVSEKVINSVWGFFTIYLFSFFVLLFALSLAGMDPLSAFSALAACLNNLGPGLGSVSENYQSLNGLSKLILSFSMLLGRLEFYTLLIIITPAYWRT